MFAYILYPILRKLTEYSTKRKVDFENNKEKLLKPSINSKLPFDIHLILKNYDPRYYLSQSRCLFSVNKVHISKAHNKYIEQSLVCYNNSEFRYNLSNYYNLKKVEIIGAKLFDFICCYKCKHITLELISVANISTLESAHLWENINIKNIVLRKICMDIKTLELIIDLPSLYGITLENVSFTDKMDYKYAIMIVIEMLNQKRNITNIKISDKRFEQQMINFIDLTKLYRYKFTDNKFLIDCDTQSTMKNKLTLKNCLEFNFTHNFSEVYNLVISSIEDITNYITQLKFHKLYKISLSGCVICEQALMSFMTNYRELEEIDLSNVPISPDNLIKIAQWNLKSLKMLNLNEVQVTSHFIEFAKRNMKSCKVIYNDNLKLYIDNTD